MAWVAMGLTWVAVVTELWLASSRRPRTILLRELVVVVRALFLAAVELLAPARVFGSELMLKRLPRQTV